MAKIQINVDSPTITVGSFCTGVGWLDIAVRLACEHVGIRTVPAFACEWDAFAAEVLRSRMADSSLEPCPIWCGDLRQFPAAGFRGVVDAAAFGFPCQDISCAGQGAGIHGARSGVFFDILDAVRTMGCRILFMENVSAITNRGLDSVLAALAEFGFAAEWTTLQAAEVGASHKRERWFCVAVSQERGLPELWKSSGSHGQSDGSGSEVAYRDIARPVIKRCDELLDGERKALRDDIDGRDSQLADATRTARRERSRRERVFDSSQTVADTEQSGLGRQRLSRTGQDGGSEAIGTGEALGNTGSTQRTEAVGRQEHARKESATGGGQLGNAISPRENARSETSRSRDTTGESNCHMGDTQRNGQRARRREAAEVIDEGLAPIFAPGPGDADTWKRILSEQPWLSPAIGKEEAQSQFRRMADGRASGMDDPRADRLRCCGNGVVVLQAATAFVGLMRRLFA